MHLKQSYLSKLSLFKICLWNSNNLNAGEAGQVLTAFVGSRVDKVIPVGQARAVYSAIKEAVFDIDNHERLSLKFNRLSSLTEYSKARFTEGMR
jgi:hypothetical protein